jgi:hypothetical protein
LHIVLVPTLRNGPPEIPDAVRRQLEVWFNYNKPRYLKEFGAMLKTPRERAVAAMDTFLDYTCIVSGGMYEPDPDVFLGRRRVRSLGTAWNEVSAVGTNALVNTRIVSFIAHPSPDSLGKTMGLVGCTEQEAAALIMANSVNQLTARNTGWRSFDRAQTWRIRNAVGPFPQRTNEHICVLPERCLRKGLPNLSTVTMNVWTARSTGETLSEAGQAVLRSLTSSEGEI